MFPKSLLELTTMACIKNIKLLQDVGDLPYEKVKSVLTKVDNAQQLRQIEINSPQIQGATVEIWLKIIERDFPIEYKARPSEPRDPAKWYKVWERYKKEHDNALLESEKQLRIDLANLQKDKEKNTSKIVGGIEVPGSLRAEAAKGPRGLFRDKKGSKPKTGADTMRKVRRETKKLVAMHSSVSKLTKATTSLANVRKAPESMINEHKRASQPVYRPFSKEPTKSSIVEGQGQPLPLHSGFDYSGLQGAKSENKFTNQPSAQTSKPDVASSAKASTSSFQRKFAQPKSLKKLGATTAFATVVKKEPCAVSNGSQTSVNKAQEKSIAAPALPAASEEMVFRPLPRVTLPTARSHSPEGGASPESAEELLEQLNEVADEIQKEHLQGAKQSQARKRKAVDIFMRPKRRIV